MCQELKTIGIETFITAKGAYTKHKDEVIHKAPLPKHVVHSIKEIVDENKQNLSFYRRISNERNTESAYLTLS